MFQNWLYNNDPWVVTTGVVILAVIISSLGLILSYQFIDRRTRQAHGELAGFVVTNVAVLYAVLLAFIAVVTWESFSKASDIAEKEANLSANIARDTVGLPQPIAGKLQAEIRGYLEVVINKEWREQRAGIVPMSGWANLARIHQDISSMAPATPGQAVLMQEMLRGLNELYDARSARLEAVEGHIQPLMWFAIGTLGALTIGYACFVRSEGLLGHLLMLAGLTAAIALILALIAELDYPFRGAISVSTHAYELALSQLGDAATPSAR